MELEDRVSEAGEFMGNESDFRITGLAFLRMMYTIAREVLLHPGKYLDTSKRYAINYETFEVVEY